MATPVSGARRIGGAGAPSSAHAWRKTAQRVFGRDWAIGWLFVLPTVVLLFGLIGYPFARAVWLSFHNAVGVRTGDFVGLQNYANLWGDGFFRQAVRVTLVFTVVAVAIKLCLGLVTALLLHRAPRFGSVLGGLVLLPYIVPDTVKALAWRVLLDPLFGAMNYILVDTLGVLSRGPSWLGSPETALPSVILVYVWAGTPFFVLLLLAGLKAIDAEQYDASAVDGATAWRQFLHITLPGLRYVLIVAVLLATIFTFNSFTTVYLLTAGGPGGVTRIYTILAYEYAVQGLRFGAGAAVAMMVAPILLILILILGRYMTADADIVDDAAGPVWRTTMALLWPVRLIVRGLVALFWLVNDLAESAVGVAGQALRRAGPSHDTPAVPVISQTAARRVGYVFLYALLGLILVFELLPFYFIVVTAFKTDLQIQQIRGMFWPEPWTLDQFRSLLSQVPFARWYANTIAVAAVSTLVSVLVASLGAYGLVRLAWRGAGVLGTAVLVAYLMPSALMFIPLYAILVGLGLINTELALMVTYPSLVLPFATWLMMGYYRTIPEELEDAAMIDGCTRFGAFFRVVLPLVRPALLAVAMFAVTQSWNEFLYAYTFLRSSSAFTLPVGLAQLIVGDVQPWGELMAASLLTALPVVIVYMIGQRFMVAGLTAGSVKG